MSNVESIRTIAKFVLGAGAIVLILAIWLLIDGNYGSEAMSLVCAALALFGGLWLRPTARRFAKPSQVSLTKRRA